MRGRRPLPLALAPDDTEALHRIARSHSAPWFRVRRSRIILAAARGERVRDIAAATQCNAATVRRTCQRYRRHGLAGLLAPPERPGRPPRISPPAASPDRRTRLPGADRARPAPHPLE